MKVYESVLNNISCLRHFYYYGRNNFATGILCLRHYYKQQNGTGIKKRPVSDKIF